MDFCKSDASETSCDSPVMASRPAAVDATEQTTAARRSSPMAPSRPAALDTTEPGAWVAHALLLAGAASVWLATMVDLLDGGLGSSNGKLVSIFDSVDGCRGFRKQRPVRLARMDSRPPTSRRGSLYHVAAHGAAPSATSTSTP